MWSSPWCAANPRKSSDTLAPEPMRLPTSVASSNTARRGTPPTNSNTFPRPRQTHSEVSPQNTCARPTLECGKAAVRYFPLTVTPLTPRSASPKSTWHSPGSQLSSRKPWVSRRSRSSAISWRLSLT